MADDADYIRHGFVAERRSLLVVSFILFFYQQAGLRIDEINVFGNKVSLDSPWWTAFSLWVLCGYFGSLLPVFCIIPDKWFGMPMNSR